MADKSFGVEQLDIFGTGTPTIQSPTDLNLNANTVAISTNFSVGGRVSIASGIVTASSGVVTYYGDGQYLTGVSGGGGGITTAATNVQVTYEVTEDGTNFHWRFTGPGNDGTDNDPDLYLARGQRYRFINNSGGSHPFYIKTTNITGSGSQYTDGVTNNGATSGNVDFNVQHDAPTRLFYQCGNHAAMNGNIYITGGASWQTTDVAAFETPEIFTLLNVGIGTDNPTQKLEVNGTIKADAFASSWVVGNNGASNYTFTGPGGLSNSSNSTLYLARGQTYIFDMNASGHGFGIQTVSGSWSSGNEYTTGITNPRADTTPITFAVPYSAPSTLYYACTAGHSGMVGTINIYP